MRRRGGVGSSLLADEALGRGDVAATERSVRTGAGQLALDVAHVGRLAAGVRLAAADGDEQAVLALRGRSTVATMAAMFAAEHGAAWPQP